jgi:tripartite ATP-independent transporter DctP family solute receptor
MKMRITQVIGMCFCLAVLGFLSSCSKSSEKQENTAQVENKTYHWRYGTVDTPANVNYRAMEELVKYLQEAAPGKWTIELYPSSQLGNAEEMIDSIQMGSLEISGPPSSTVANYVPEFGVWDMPYLFRDEAHVDAVMSGPIGQQFGSLAEKTNIKFLAWWEVGFRCLANNKRPINGPEDVAGLRLRVMSNEIHQALFSTLGADPVPMSLSDAYVANQNGTIDGQDNPLANLIANSTYEVCKYMAVTNHVYTPLPLVMSLKAWNEMTAEDQKIFMQCLDRATAWQRDSNRTGQQNAASELTAKGNIVTYPNIAAFEAKMQAVYTKYPQYADMITQIKAVK